MAEQKGLPEFKRTEQLTPATQPMNFGEAMRNVASASNILSSLGSELYLKSSVARSARAGIELGKTPSGELLPALTKSDEAFIQGYRNSSVATLSLQAEQLMQSSLVELNKLPKLNAEAINNYSNQMTEGLEAIASQATKLDQVDLRKTFGKALITSQSQLELKLAEQNKKELKDNYANYATQMTRGVFDISVSGDFETASEVSKRLGERTDKMVELGFLTNVQGESIKKDIRTQQLTGRYYREALQAKEDDKLDKFLSDWQKTPPKDLTPTEWIDVSKNLMALISVNETAEARRQSFLVAEGKNKIVTGDLTNEDLLKYSEEMTPTNYTNFLTELFKEEQKGKAKRDAKRYVTENWNNAGALANADQNAIEEVFADNWQALQEQGGTDEEGNYLISELEAKSLIAASAATPINSFTKELNAMATNGTPDAMEMASLAVQSVNAQNPANLTGLSKESKNMLRTFRAAKLAGQANIEAKETATRNVLELDENKRKARSLQWQQISEEMFGNNDYKLVKKTLDNLGLKEKEVDAPMTLGVNYKNMLEANFNALGNEALALEATREEILQSHDYTYVNGSKKFVYKPVENFFNISKKELPFVWSQAARQAMSKAQAFNELYDEGKSDFRYEVQEPFNVTEQEYMQANTELEKLVTDENFPFFSFTRGDFEFIPGATSEQRENVRRAIELRKTIAAFENPGRPVVSRLHRDGRVEDFYFNIESNSGVSVNGLPVYTVNLEIFGGEVLDFAGVNAVNNRNVFYIPDQADFNHQYGRYINLMSEGRDKALTQMREEIEKHEEDMKQLIKDKRIEQGLEEESTIQEEQFANRDVDDVFKTTFEQSPVSPFEMTLNDEMSGIENSAIRESVEPYTTRQFKKFEDL